MSEKAITLKDIAACCGVTPTVVSAVLNRRSGRISCSAAKRTLILQTAEKLHYQANVFARSMKMKRTPIVGLMFHLNESEVTQGLSAYVNNCLSSLTFAFNKHRLEALFIPYSTEAEQLERVRNLIANGLIGGIVTNIIPESHREICAYLSEASLPYMVLGAPLAEDIYCAYPLTSALDAKLQTLAHSQGCASCYQAVIEDGRIVFRRYPFVNGYMWHTPHTAPERVFAERESAFFALMGVAVLNQMKREHCLPKHFTLVESFAFRSLLPEKVDAVLVPDVAESAALTAYVERSLSDWMERGIPPVRHTAVFPDSEKKLIVKNHHTKELVP